MLAPVHGGLFKPVNRIEPRDRVNYPAWRKLPAIAVHESDRTSLYRIADGTLSPLNGPMSQAEYRTSLEHGAIERGGVRWAWTIPTVLPVTDDEAAQCTVGREVGLHFSGDVFGKLRVKDVYDWDKAEFVKRICGPSQVDQPGRRSWSSDPRAKCVSGEITLASFIDVRPFAKRMLPPLQTRALIERKGYEQTVALPTCSPLLRADEYTLARGAETLLRETGKRIGAILNPSIASSPGGAVPAEVRMQTYEALVQARSFGAGDIDEELWKQRGQSLAEQLELVGLDVPTYSAGPREAVMQAIYRQNCGYTHFIVGRNHVDAFGDHESALRDDADPRSIFEQLGGALAIKAIAVGPAAYIEEIGRVGLVDEHPGKTQVTLSGAMLRETLRNGEMPDARVMRATTAKVLAVYYQVQNKAEA